MAREAPMRRGGAPLGPLVAGEAPADGG